MRASNWRLFGQAVLAAVATTLVACGGSGGGSGDGGSGAGNLNISGKLGGSGFQSASVDNFASAITLSDLEIYAIAFTSPPVIAKAAVNADGTFSVDLAGAKGSAITAIFRDTANANATVGTIAFVDSTNKDIDGNTKSSSSIVLSDSVSLGALTLGTDGKVAVDVATIAASIPAPASAATAFDMSGVWKMTAASNLPTGYSTVCAADVPQNDCESLPDQTEVAMIRLGGKLFTPTTGGGVTTCNKDDNSACAVTDGTVGTAPRFAMALWQKDAFVSCGRAMGFDEDDARKGGNLHVDQALPTVAGGQVAMGAFGGAYNPWGWIKAAAKATFAIPNCKGSVVTIDGKQLQAYACRGEIMDNLNAGTGQYGFQVNLGQGGCQDANGKPLMVNNFGGAQTARNIYSNNTQNCESSTTDLPTGFSSQSCAWTGDPDGSGPMASQDYQCTWTGGQFASQGSVGQYSPNYASPVSGGHVGAPEELVAAGADCKNGATDGQDGSAFTLGQLQCFANYYYSNNGNNAGTCNPEFRFNWGAQTAGDFYHVDYRGRPRGQFLLDVLTYNSAGDVATLDTTEREAFTVASGAGSSVTCNIERGITFGLRKTSSTTAQMEIRFAGRMASTATVCQALAKTALENVAYNVGKADNLKRRAAMNADLEHMLSPSAILMNATKQ